MNGYSEDLRQKIVSAVERGMSKSQAARTFDVSLSSVKRYVKRAEEWRSLAPKDKPGAAPKLDGKVMKLLEEDLKERPFATLRERCEYIGVVTGIWVSRSTMCRAIARVGHSRKKGGALPPSATSS
jgi:transposase